MENACSETIAKKHQPGFHQSVRSPSDHAPCSNLTPNQSQATRALDDVCSLQVANHHICAGSFLVDSIVLWRHLPLSRLLDKFHSMNQCTRTLLRVLQPMKQLKAGNDHVTYILLLSQGLTMMTFLVRPRLRTLCSHIRRYIPTAPVLLWATSFLKRKDRKYSNMMKTYVSPNIDALLFLSASQPSDYLTRVNPLSVALLMMGVRITDPTRVEVSPPSCL